MLNTVPDSDTLLVVAAIICDPHGWCLLSKRHAHKHQGSRWEFPGGKVDLGENLEQALIRELDEELGLQAGHSIPFMTVDHDYGDKKVRLCFRELINWSGVPHGREGQLLDWFELSALHSLRFPAANRPVVTALSLPDQILVLPSPLPENPHALLRAAIVGGVGMVYLRGISNQQRLRDLVDYVHELGAKTLIADDPELATKLGTTGVHLTTRTQNDFSVRPDCPLVSLACHDQASLTQAARLKADMVFLSSVRATPSHGHVSPLGWKDFSRLATGRPFAVYALGGVNPADLTVARAHGARGIAGIRGFLQQP